MSRPAASSNCARPSSPRGKANAAGAAGAAVRDDDPVLSSDSERWNLIAELRRLRGSDAATQGGGGCRLMAAVVGKILEREGKRVAAHELGREKEIAEALRRCAVPRMEMYDTLKEFLARSPSLAYTPYQPLKAALGGACRALELDGWRQGPSNRGPLPCAWCPRRFACHDDLVLHTAARLAAAPGDQQHPLARCLALVAATDTGRLPAGPSAAWRCPACSEASMSLEALLEHWTQSSDHAGWLLLTAELLLAASPPCEPHRLRRWAEEPGSGGGLVALRMLLALPRRRRRLAAAGDLSRAALRKVLARRGIAWPPGRFAARRPPRGAPCAACAACGGACGGTCGACGPPQTRGRPRPQGRTNTPPEGHGTPRLQHRKRGQLRLGVAPRRG